MVRIITNSFRTVNHGFRARTNGQALIRRGIGPNYVSRKAKILAWAIFVMLFIESDTLGLIPRQLYFVYRNVRISDLILYGLVIYSFYNIKEYSYLYRSKALIIVKLLLIYLVFEFVVSTISYGQNPVEYFFRLKGLWYSFMIFPFLLLLKRNGFMYLAKLILPVAIVSNVLYILTAVTGKSFIPGLFIAEQVLPGGLKVYRVYGGTFYGDFFFLAFIYQWVTDKFKKYQLPLVILFIIPHILAFGRGSWLKLSLIVVVIIIWNVLRKRDFKVIFRQVVLIAVLVFTLIYSFKLFIPQSDYMLEALNARIVQGQQDYEHGEGTYGTRLASIARLIELWENNNVLFGIGMHPMWVVKPMTVEENLYAWGFSDTNWPGVLAAYGLIGFIMAIIFQIQYFVIVYKILKYNRKIDIPLFFVLIMFTFLFFDTVVDFSNALFRFALWGFFGSYYLIAMTVYKHEETIRDLAVQQGTV